MRVDSLGNAHTLLPREPRQRGDKGVDCRPLLYWLWCRLNSLWWSNSFDVLSMTKQSMDNIAVQWPCSSPSSPRWRTSRNGLYVQRQNKLWSDSCSMKWVLRDAIYCLYCLHYLFFVSCQRKPEASSTEDHDWTAMMGDVGFSSNVCLDTLYGSRFVCVQINQCAYLLLYWRVHACDSEVLLGMAKIFSISSVLVNPPWPLLARAFRKTTLHSRGSLQTYISYIVGRYIRCNYSFWSPSVHIEWLVKPVFVLYIFYPEPLGPMSFLILLYMKWVSSKLCVWCLAGRPTRYSTIFSGPLCEPSQRQFLG